MSAMQLNATRLNAVRLNNTAINSVGERLSASHAGAPPSTPEVDANGYIVFKDPEVARICAENWGDGTGITLEQAAAVTSFKYVFQKSDIRVFDEAYKFKGITELEASGRGTGGAFNRCTSLESITLPNSIVKLQDGDITYGGGDSVFYECTSLKECAGLGNVTYIGVAAFYKCSTLEDVDVDWSKVTAIGNNAFDGCNIAIDKLALPKLEVLRASSLVGIKTRLVVDLGSITELSKQWYNNLFSTTTECVILPQTLTTMTTHSMYMSASFKVLVMRGDSPPQIASNTFVNIPSTAQFYVPNVSVEAYKTATNWSAYASRIKGISELPIDNPELYNEIKDYL